MSFNVSKQHYWPFSLFLIHIIMITVILFLSWSNGDDDDDDNDYETSKKKTKWCWLVILFDFDCYWPHWLAPFKRYLFLIEQLPISVMMMMILLSELNLILIISSLITECSVKTEELWLISLVRNWHKGDHFWSSLWLSKSIFIGRELLLINSNYGNVNL